jgi:D-alanyl-D-alanine carboxypeptidase
VAGDYDSFVDMMNAKAKELGMTDTMFSCPSGLDDENQYSTVADMVKLVRYAMENEVFRQLISTKSYQIKADSNGTKDHVLVTTNNLLGVYEGCIGGKTGTTTSSGAHVI